MTLPSNAGPEGCGAFTPAPAGQPARSALASGSGSVSFVLGTCCVGENVYKKGFATLTCITYLWVILIDFFNGLFRFLP